MNTSVNKRLIKTLSIFILFLFTQAATADQPAKVVVHINNPLKMTMMVNNIKNLRKSLGPEAKIIVVVNGPAVARFTTLSQSRSQLDSILEQNTEVEICSIALRNNKIKKTSLYKGTSYLDRGGAARLVELQQKGFSYIKP